MNAQLTMTDLFCSHRLFVRHICMRRKDFALRNSDSYSRVYNMKKCCGTLQNIQDNEVHFLIIHL